jgi:hypothetical protein
LRRGRARDRAHATRVARDGSDDPAGSHAIVGRQPSCYASLPCGVETHRAAILFMEAAMTRRNRIPWTSVAILALSSQLAGCAGYSITPDTRGNGYVVYRPEPYLLVSYSTSGDSKNPTVTTTASIVYLPNFRYPYRVESHSNLGKADFKFTFDDGWRLTGVEDRGDNSDLAGKVLDIIKSSVPGPKSLASLMQGPQPSFDLYGFEFDEKTGAAVRLKKLPH